jgi:NAD(P) transhydrogenase subunit alpha
MASSGILETYVFVLALFLGFQLISKVPSILHTPLMSGTNAIHGIILVGAIVLASSAHGTLGVIIATAAVILATMNVVGGFVVTDRILGMFRQKSQAGSPPEETARHE